MALCSQQIEILKRVDNATKSVIDGYVREAQRSLDIKHEIPLEIIQIILLFYYLGECFDIHADDITILGDHKDIIQKCGDSNSYWHSMTFGATSIPSMSDNIVIWTFEMLRNKHGAGLALGHSFGVASQIKKGADIEYKMAVTLHWPDARLKLVNFECLSSADK